MIGKKIIQIESVDSTNNYVANLVNQNNIEHGTAILADEQTAGKGQKGNVWISKPGDNLITSIFVKHENLSVNEQYFLTIFVAISVVKTLKKIGIDAEIKWPNDIIVGNKKIAGILIENQIISNQIKSSIIGIGLNVNQLNLEEIGGTSIRSILNQFYSNYDILLSLIYELNKDYILIQNKLFIELKTEYMNLLWLINETSSFTDLLTNLEFNGIIRDIDLDGRIVIESKEGFKRFDLKEIKFNARIVP